VANHIEFERVNETFDDQTEHYHKTAVDKAAFIWMRLVSFLFMALEAH